MDGCQTATATYPRPFGFVTLKELSEGDTDPKPERHFEVLDKD